MNYNLIKIDGTIHVVKHMEGVGFYVDIIDGQATTKPTKEELLQELRNRYVDVQPIASASTGETKG
jgi:hypothetical protein